MIKGTVRYWDLGRGKAKGEFNVDVIDADEFNQQLYNEFSKHLMSRDISFNKGKIFAGFHSVGKFEFIAVEEVET